MRKSFVLWLAVGTVMFAAAPVLVEQAPYESTMGLVQKIFYYHAPLGIMMFLSAFVSGLAAANDTRSAPAGPLKRYTAAAVPETNAERNIIMPNGA